MFSLPLPSLLLKLSVSFDRDRKTALKECIEIIAYGACGAMHFPQLNYHVIIVFMR